MSTAPSTATGQQTWSSEIYDKHTRFVSELGQGVLDWLDPKPGERILDLGCGDGVLTEKLQEAGAEVVGCDASDAFIEAAKARGLDARLVDGHDLTFADEFDAVFSNAALHWMLKPEDVIAGVKRALKPGGRFVGEFGGHGNVAAVATAMRAVGTAMDGDAALADPWFFPTAEEYQVMLESHGFAVERILLFARPTPLPTGVSGWLLTMRQPFFDQFGDRSDEARGKVETALAPSLKNASGEWHADYVRLRFEAVLSD